MSLVRVQHPEPNLRSDSFIGSGRSERSVLGDRFRQDVEGLAVRDREVAVDRLRKEWGARVGLMPIGEIRELEGELAGGDPVAGKRWVAIAEAASTGDYSALVELLVEQNRVVMDARGSASWVEVRDGRFHVRFHEERGDLPQRDELATMWRHSYFLDALRAVAGQIGGTA